MADTGFSLHPRLETDTCSIGQSGLCEVLLMNDSRFPWLILVPRVVDASEWFDLDAATQAMLNAEVLNCAAKFKRCTNADKINIAALGNQVPQLHIHIIARFKNDAAWPSPVWACGTACAYFPEALENMREKLINSNITNL